MDHNEPNATGLCPPGQGHALRLRTEHLLRRADRAPRAGGPARRVDRCELPDPLVIAAILGHGSQSPF